MKIGIDASRAFASQRTGIEEYSYQVIKHLADKFKNHQVILYINFTNYEIIRKYENTNEFKLPDDWKIKVIKLPYLWTQVGLSLEMLFHPVDTLFVPGHVVPIIHPKKTIVTVHGLEFEIFPECYSFWARIYMRWSIKYSCKWAKKVIAVSENTKKDLMRLYGVSESKIEVIYNGVNSVQSSKFKVQSYSSKFKVEEPYLLFIGRLEKRKNIEGIVDAYKILKEKYNIPHTLVLAGGPGYGFDIIRLKIKNLLKISNFKLKIIETGYVDEATKQELLKNTDIFLFPTFYEGFGLPVLEAQSMGVPVVCSNTSSLPEIVTVLERRSRSELSAVLCDPKSPESIAEAARSLISNQELKNDIIKKGYENIKRFSWENCSFKVSKLLINQDGNK